MSPTYEIKDVRIIYFSGSGGTERIAKAFEKELTDRGIEVIVKNLGAPLKERMEAHAEQDLLVADLNILIFAVHAADAPKPVYDWIRSTGCAEAGRKIAVISVSGGGDMWPNKGSRNHCIKTLEEKGFEVTYDRMMCMPSNVFIEYNDHLIMRLLNTIPGKVSLITDDLLKGKILRSHFKKGAILNRISESEQKNAGKFARKIRITDACTTCGWCERNCPTSNIKISEITARPEFSDRCVICTRCIYGCPARALRYDGAIILKNGFDLNAVERRMAGVEPDQMEKCCRGLLYKGVKKYLSEKSQ
ncbi:MAG: EFR1 family ferrodoxin [Eubacteriales bacterium]|nr:EFR1 family ferrodoxin [Eubacteriales bacterium]MDD3200049.1 EFR1 family ferrodoxin [Eubacteriales bacterium]MDD4121709.1 EFR1 family ferrodoxin [Eubacteriales bacterium]MDD4630558.1 EFR1 family ferrodoxin [Eubacteriales bacterium]